MKQLIHLQLAFSQELPKVFGNLDYNIFYDKLKRISEIIELGKLDLNIIKHLVREAEIAKKKEAEDTGKTLKALSIKELKQIQKTANQVLRCTIARLLTGESYRVFSAHLADSVLLQKFCLLENWGGTVKVLSKSTLQRYEEMVPEEVIRKIVKRNKKGFCD